MSNGVFQYYRCEDLCFATTVLVTYDDDDDDNNNNNNNNNNMHIKSAVCFKRHIVTGMLASLTFVILNKERKQWKNLHSS
jgi:hypothetical protein